MVAEEYQAAETESPWSGVDLSGTVVFVGAGTGRLLSMLSEQVEQHKGQLLVVDFRRQSLQDIRPAAPQDCVTYLQARPRELPVLSETADLLVISGILRGVPTRGLPVMFDEMNRVLVPGGQLRISDVIDPSDAQHDTAWRIRNELVVELGAALRQPAAVSVKLTDVAEEAQSIGFEDLSVSLLPGYALTDAWLEEMTRAIRAMASRVVDTAARDAIINDGLERLRQAYALGDQRAAQRFVLRGNKSGDLALRV